MVPLIHFTAIIALAITLLVVSLYAIPGSAQQYALVVLAVLLVVVTFTDRTHESI